MLNDVKISQLLESERWTGFFGCTAAGLQINLALLVRESGEVCLQAPAICPCCRSPYTAPDPVGIAGCLAAAAGEFASTATQAGDLIVLPLSGDFLLLARECPHCRPAKHALLSERATIARKLLLDFGTALGEGFTGGKRSIELSALRQMNQFMLSLLAGEAAAVTGSLDLILSAAVILLEAEGSWLEYTESGRPQLISKGNTAAVAEYLRQNNGESEAVVIRGGATSIRLGVLGGTTTAESRALLRSLAQECGIVLEVARLFRLVEKQLASVLEAINSAVLIVNQHGCVTYLNQAAEQLLGTARLDLLGTPVDPALGPWAAGVRARTTRSVSGFSDLFSRDQECRRIDWQVSPIRDGEAIAGWLVLVDDRTDHFRWLEAARRAERLAVTSTMVGALAHELRNPLGAANGLLQLIGRKQSPEKVKSYADLIMRELDRATWLLNEFLLLGRPAEMAAEPVDPAAFMHELAPLLESEAANHGAEFRLDTEAVPRIEADSGQITQVVLNLVRNAAEAAGPEGQVAVELREAAAGVALSVKDNGPGLPPAVAAKLFQPFFTTKERGTGLGLSVVQAIVHNHGGSVEAADAPDGGAVFTVTLPGYAEPDGQASGLDVLIVAADREIGYPCERALRAAGLNAAAKLNLADALLPPERCNPAVLILEEQSLQTGDPERIAAAWPEARAIVLTRRNQTSDSAVLPGAVPLAAAPLDYVQLVGLVRNVLAADRMQPDGESR